ncbi:MAG: radical SAM family heme chaperone HemW [Acidobacteria bacterium]|nr:radical SAM family heme chaperone HemW [Acidobacteriota bacterium]
MAALEQHILDVGRGEPADTVFFGGGTPSLLDPLEIGRLLDACRRAFTLAPGAEITLEANPESVTEGRLSGYRACGVNRVSFGVQSFRDQDLVRLGRLHTADRAREACALARRAGFDNIGMDLMLWLPQQTTADVLASTATLIDLSPEHASLYLLELYPNAPLREDMAREGWSLAPDEDAADMYVAAMERLEGAGYRQYEISNVARPGRVARHNLKYWTDGEWLGFGSGAHSTRQGARWRNVSRTEDYIERIRGAVDPTADRRVLSKDERLEEALFTALRLVEGVDLAAVGQTYGVDVWSRYGDRLGPFVDAGLLVHEPERLRLTRRGMLLASEVMAVFV